jgi:rhamnosyl/mannosyltransferase
MGKDFLGERFVHVYRAPDEELPDFYRAADVFCLPSTSSAEAFGISTLEAMACGLPVITTELGTGTSVVNVHERTGLVVPPRDVSNLTAAILRLLQDAELRTVFGRNARERAVAEYDVAAMFKRMATVYATLLSGR